MGSEMCIRDSSHTGDLQILACGKSFEDALHDLTLGVIEFLFDRSSIKGRERFRFEVEADDLHELVINFFEEILFIFDTEHFVFSDVNIEEFSQGDRYKIVAELIGEKRTERHIVKTEIKAVTYAKQIVEKRGNEWMLQVVFDI